MIATRAPGGMCTDLEQCRAPPQVTLVKAAALQLDERQKPERPQARTANRVGKHVVVVHAPEQLLRFSDRFELTLEVDASCERRGCHRRWHMTLVCTDRLRAIHQNKKRAGESLLPPSFISSPEGLDYVTVWDLRTQGPSDEV